MVARTPALVIQPSLARDVRHRELSPVGATCLSASRVEAITSLGMYMPPGGLTLDMSRLRGVEGRPDAMLAHVGAGSRLHDVDRATQQYGLATVLGFVSKVGVAGSRLAEVSAISHVDRLVGRQPRGSRDRYRRRRHQNRQPGSALRSLLAFEAVAETSAWLLDSPIVAPGRSQHHRRSHSLERGAD